MEKNEEGQVCICKLCGCETLTEVPKSSSLLGVTSDDRVWNCSGAILVCSRCGHVQKKVDDDWQENATEVYSEYALYQSSGGAEHVVLTGPEQKPRSHLLLDRLRDQMVIPEKGRMLDVGCGSGPLLRSFGSMFPRWSLVGFERGDSYRAAVQDIPQVESFHSDSLDRIPGRFDLIALYFVLEHLPSPAHVVEELRAKLNPGGLLVIVVPDYTENPFDLLVIDHCSHFRKDSLSSFLGRNGFEVLDVSDQWIPRALVAVVRKTECDFSDGEIAVTGNVFAEVQASLAWLSQVAEDATRHAQGSDLGIFGTATAGSWLAGVLGGQAEFFIDEDPARTGPGNKHLGRPVYQPENAPLDASIYIPLPPALAQSIFSRLHTKYPGLRLVLPPMPS